MPSHHVQHPNVVETRDLRCVLEAEAKLNKTIDNGVGVLVTAKHAIADPARVRADCDAIDTGLPSGPCLGSGVIRTA